MSLRDDIRQAASEAKTPVLIVPTPEIPKWDGKIGVTRASPHAIAASYLGMDDGDALDQKAAFVVLCACDEHGAMIFGDEDVMWLSSSKYLTPMIERLYCAGLEVCGQTEANRNSWRKNLPSTGDGGSPSSCAAPSTPDSAST